MKPVGAKKQRQKKAKMKKEEKGRAIKKPNRKGGQRTKKDCTIDQH
jgi:hypothetical protein